MNALVLLSGGIDSTVCASLACEAYGPGETAGLTILYGQKHAREAGAASLVAERLGLASHEFIELPAEVFAGGGSTLIERELDIPDGPYPGDQGPVSTYVPFRNGALISIATAVAMRTGVEALYFGAHAEDATRWAYPDCTPEFLGAMKNAVWTGTYHKVRLVTPLEWMTKRDIVRRGIDLGAPFELTWSCYRGGEEACGVCATCLSRLEAFAANGAVDPIRYAEEKA